VNHPSWGGTSSKTLLLGAVLALGALLIAAMTVSVKPQLAVGNVIKVCELPFCLQERLPLRFASFGFAAFFSPHRLKVQLTSPVRWHHEGARRFKSTLLQQPVWLLHGFPSSSRLLSNKATGVGVSPW
jgi:hypothetical protein